jgi:transposase InsO family protein
MKKLGLRSSQPSAPKYKKAKNEHLAVPNTLNREFNVINPNQIWCGDVTYIWIGKRRTNEGLSTKEIQRCLKRYVVRELYPLILDDLQNIGGILT